MSHELMSVSQQWFAHVLIAHVLTGLQIGETWATPVVAGSCATTWFFWLLCFGLLGDDHVLDLCRRWPEE